MIYHCIMEFFADLAQLQTVITKVVPGVKKL